MDVKTSILLATGLFTALEPNLQAQRAHAGNTGSAVPRGSIPSSVAVRPPAANLGGRPFPIRATVATPTGLISPVASYTGLNPGALRSGINRSRSANYGLGYGGFYGIPFVSYIDGSGYSNYPSYSEQAEGVGVQSDVQTQQDSVAQQLDQMNAQIAELREVQMQANQMQSPFPMQPGLGQPGLGQPGPYAPPQSAAPPLASANEQQPAQAPITLILQSGAKLTVTNYAVMSGVVWDFSKQPSRKIPVSTINLTASQKATEDTGGEFPQLAVTP